MKKISLCVGIPAYNEEANIKRLVLSILRQKEIGFILDRIIIASDGSTDKTIQNVLSIKSKKIRILKSFKRIGMSTTQDRILKNAKSEIVVLLNGDIIISDNKFIAKLIKPFKKYYKVGIVSPNILPIKGKSFFESVINYSVFYKNSIYRTINNGNNIYMCHGRARALHRDFYKNLIWSKKINEDAYSYLSAVHNKFAFIYNPDAEILYKSPTNYHDHFIQSKRFLNSKKELSYFFPLNLINKEYRIQPFPIVKFSIKYFLMNPFYFLSYLAISLYAKFQRSPENNERWDISVSTKNLSYK